MKTKLPTVKELSTTIKSLKKYIFDECIQEDDTLPSIDITIGYTPRTEDEQESWDYQSGDNSFTGDAYRHPIWAVATIYRRSNSRELAKELNIDLGNNSDLEEYDTY
jgi:hypothetical protein